MVKEDFLDYIYKGIDRSDWAYSEVLSEILGGWFEF